MNYNTARVREIYKTDLESIAKIEDLLPIALKLYQDVKEVVSNPANYLDLDDFPLQKSLDHYFEMLGMGSSLPAVWLADISENFDEDTLGHSIKPFVHFDQFRLYEIKERYLLLRELEHEIDSFGNEAEMMWNEEHEYNKKL